VNCSNWRSRSNGNEEIVFLWNLSRKTEDIYVLFALVSHKEKLLMLEICTDLCSFYSVASIQHSFVANNKKKNAKSVWWVFVQKLNSWRSQ
jgi:hypothetical protein